MTDLLIILTVCLLFVYGYRVMGRVDRALFPEYRVYGSRTRSGEGKSALRRLLALYFSGESLRVLLRTLRGGSRGHGDG